MPHRTAPLTEYRFGDYHTENSWAHVKRFYRTLSTVPTPCITRVDVDVVEDQRTLERLWYHFRRLAVVQPLLTGGPGA